jgi:hypothetical protein
MPNGGGGGASSTDIGYQGMASLELDGSNVGASFNITGTSAATVVNGGTGNDTFTVGNFDAMGGPIDGNNIRHGPTINGNGGNDSLKIDDTQGNGVLGNLPAGATVTNDSLNYAVQDGQIIRTASYGFSTPNGGGSGSSLVEIVYNGINRLELDGSNVGATFYLTGTSAGMLPGGTLLKGGTGNDVFALSAAGNWQADGGGGTNALDYSDFSGIVDVDLQKGIATGFGGGIRNIQSWTPPPS